LPAWRFGLGFAAKLLPRQSNQHVPDSVHVHLRYLSGKVGRSPVVRKRFGKLLWKLALPALVWISPTIINSQSTHGSSNSGMERDFQEAMAAQDRGDLARAEALLFKLHNAHPGIFAVDESLGLLLASRGEVSRALPLLEAAVREQPSSDTAHANLGAALYQVHRNQSALEEFQRAVRINPRNASAQQSLGRLYMENRRPNEAAKALLEAQRLNPEDSDLKLDCITALLAANRLGEAQQMLSTVADVDRSARAQSLLGEADEKAGKFHDAAEHFAHAVELEPSEENAWMLGAEFLRHWTFDAAATEFEAASAKFPDSKRIRLGLGAALFGAAQYAKAIPVFADLLGHEPDNAMYAEMLGISCNAPMEAISPRCSALVTYAQAHPADAKAATNAATFLMAQNEDAQSLNSARKLLVRAIAADPNLPEAQFQMGKVLQISLNWKGSIPYLERAVKLKPDFAQAHYSLARAYWRLGRKQDGQAQMDLQKKFARQEQEDLDRRLKQIMRFAVEFHQ
jgi:tetratricopeptide (TPR) repeat protein